MGRLIVGAHFDFDSVDCGADRRDAVLHLKSAYHQHASQRLHTHSRRGLLDLAGEGKLGFARCVPGRDALAPRANLASSVAPVVERRLLFDRETAGEEPPIPGKCRPE